MIQLTPAGLQTDTFEEILAEIQTDFRAAYGAAIATRVGSTAGQMQRLIALRVHEQHEALLALYQALAASGAEGVLLDRILDLVGVARKPAAYAEVYGTATGTPGTSIPDGTRISVGSPQAYVFQVADGPYTIGGGGTVSGVHLVAEEVGPADVSGLGAWAILDTVFGFDSFDDDTQPIVGQLAATDAEYRTAGTTERYRRASGSLDAIEAAVALVDGVTYVRAWHNVTADPVDADGIPLHAINVVAQGGAAADIARAIWDSGPAGHLFYGTDESEAVIDNENTAHVVSFDRVATIPIWVDVVLTTSTSEESPPDGLAALVADLLVAYATESWDIGTDVLAHRLAGALAGLAGVDAVAVTTSLDGVTYDATKKPISIREQAELTIARVSVSEV